MKINFKVIPTEKGYTVPIPSVSTSGSAGIDLRAALDCPKEIAVGEISMIPLGLAVEIPDGNVGLVFGRSGLGGKHGITLANSVGVIDSDYRGQLLAALINHGDKPYTIEPGERIVQLVILPCVAIEAVEVSSLGETERGNGGYGSTGRQ